eukprot:SAG11_NODE_908_length_6589_cov_5.484129_4_plen_206_part_00
MSGARHSSPPPPPLPRSLALKTSSNGGKSWGGLRIVDWYGLNPAVVFDAKSERVIVHYPAAYELPMPHPQIGGTHLKQMLCTPAGVCGTPRSLDRDLSWRGGPPLGPPGPFGVGAGPGLGVQLATGPHAGRTLFSGHAGQVSVASDGTCRSCPVAVRSPSYRSSSLPWHQCDRATTRQSRHCLGGRHMVLGQQREELDPEPEHVR